jgi:beta-glucosidase/6-phospho-beta-glucosidase/beta-galactosidase/glycosyltransferase involved in cell wall biosynthesis
MISEPKPRESLLQARSEKQYAQSAATHGSLPYPEFVWGSGLECSFIPHLNVDQFAWTQHDRFWKEDFKLAREVAGITNLRYSLPWHQIETTPGHFNWHMADERIEEASRLGINLMMDVMHFGTPLWLKQAVGDPEFPEALERYTEALVTRYRRDIRTWCPCNEPLVCALFSGDFGFWPPHARKWRGYMPVLSRVVQGVSRSIRAIRRALPEGVILLCDAAENFKARTETLAEEVSRRNLRRFVVMDLLTGRVDQHHPLYTWLTGYGLAETDLEWFRSNPQKPTVLGLDYYPHSDWQLEESPNGVRQRRADNPAGFAAIARDYYTRYGLPMMLTETSIEGASMNREIWFEQMVDQITDLRSEGIPLTGFIWWPLLDQIDWDGALTHHIGKIHSVGLFKLTRQPDGLLQRTTTPMVKVVRDAAASREERVGALEHVTHPAFIEEDQGPSIYELTTDMTVGPVKSRGERIGIASSGNGHAKALHPANGHNANGGNGHGNSNGSSGVPKAGLTAHRTGVATSHGLHKTGESSTAQTEPVAEVADGHAEQVEETLVPEKPRTHAASAENTSTPSHKSTHRYGIVVFSHLRWGFVWQRPQQFLSRFARKHTVLFVEEPFFDQAEGTEPKLEYHRVMPNVIVVCPHMAPSFNRNPRLPELLRAFVREALHEMNTNGEFDKPLLWYYSPMDASWSLGHFENRGIVYDCMDELSQFTGAPKPLVANEARLIEVADVVFTGGYELWLKKQKQTDNAHFFGCGVEYSHFSLAQNEKTAVPPDIDFMARPILGWFGVVDERVDYGMVGEMARMRPDWSFAMVGPVVKVDPNLLPHSPNLFWLGQRDYQVLPNYCRAFDICMMPFAINAATQYINPTKALEYLATGRPVISTPVSDVVRQYQGIVDIVSSATEFVEAAEKLLKNPDPARIQQGIERAKASSWENTVTTMQSIIRDSITKSNRRSLKEPTPLSEEELSYQYRHTQGS